MKPIKVLFWSSFIFMVMVIILMARIGVPLKTPSAPGGIVSLELARTTEKTCRILCEWNHGCPENCSMYQPETTARRVSSNPRFGTLAAIYHIQSDYIFIVFYCLTIYFGLLWAYFPNTQFNEVLKPGYLKYGLPVFIAGLLDVIENLHMMKALQGEEIAPLLNWIYYPAVFKFSIIVVMLLIVFIGGWDFGLFRLLKRPFRD